MAKDERQDFRICRPSAPLPSESDFDPFGGDLDAQSAWRNFGELSLKKAYDLFTTAPENYQEDFMFMGSAAFSYYFPVIDRYIREITGSDEGDDCEVAILGSAVVAQFDWKGATIGGHLLHEIEDLSAFVQANIQLYSPAEKDQRRIKREWMRVDSKVAEQKTLSEQDVDGNPH